MIGILMFGKISVGVRIAASGPMIKMSKARTMKVYGRCSAMRTMAIIGRAAKPDAMRNYRGCGSVSEGATDEELFMQSMLKKTNDQLERAPASRHGQQYIVMRAPPPGRSPISKQNPCSLAIAATSGNPKP